LAEKEKPTDLAVLQRSFEWIDGNEDYIVLGAKDDGKLVGSLMGNRGIGRQLMTEIERIDRERNCSYIMFVSSAKRKEAYRFYEALGYGRDEVKGIKKYLF